ncbi:MAG: hypothetical protein C0595_09445 [Marinilabiliales bacterium]|nr:MAG: hypothetical protein C0595_09445 [Marinilabiliales bacterium]
MCLIRSIALIVFIIQIIFIKIYLQRFNYGPLELILMKFTYLAF